MFALDAEVLALLLSPVALGALGLCIGSFLNVVVHRLPRMMDRQWWRDIADQLQDEESWRRTFDAAAPAPLQPAGQHVTQQLAQLSPLTLAKPRSHCPACGHTIRWYENIPLLSWLYLKCRCAGCGTPISARYPVIELATGLLFAAAAWHYGPQPLTLMWCAVLATLLALAAIDWDTTLLPDSLTLPLLWGGVLAAALGWTIPTADALWGAAAGYLSLWSVYWAFKLATGKEGMGYGDFKLLAALGAWLGWQALVPIVLMASVIGAVVGIGMKFGNALREGRYVPFGPFLAGAGIVVMLTGLPRVLGWIGWA